MYKIIPLTRNTNLQSHDFLFSDFASFYNIACNLTVPLRGKFKIGIKTNNIQEVKDFLKVEDKYKAMQIFIYMSESQVEYIAMHDFNANVSERVKPFTEFKELAKERHLLFAKGVDSLLYKSIEHDVVSMETALNILLEKVGAFNTVTEQILETEFILNKVVYPRSVLLEYLWLGRWREFKLYKCLDAIGNDVVLGAIVKNLKDLVKKKATYFQTGKTDNLLKTIDTKRLLQMYRIFVVERGGLDDVVLLFKLYERGLSSYDFIQE